MEDKLSKADEEFLDKFKKVGEAVLIEDEELLKELGKY